MVDTTRIRPSGWKSERGRAKYLAAYQAAMELWPVPYTSRYVKTRYGITHVIESGTSGPPVVLLHAATGFGATQWYPSAEALATSNRVFAVDYIGSAGRGTQSRAMFSREDCADWLTDLFDGLDIHRPVVVGSSQGGWLALNLALLVPERVGLLVLLAPAASILPFRPWVRAGIRLGPYMPAWTGRGAIESMVGDRAEINDRLVQLVTLHLRHFRYQRQAPFPSAFADAELRGLRLPVLLLVGEHEVIYDPQKALARVRRLVPDVDAELVSGSGHLINMELPQFTSDRILRFQSVRSPSVATPGSR